MYEIRFRSTHGRKVSLPPDCLKYHTKSQQDYPPITIFFLTTIFIFLRFSFCNNRNYP